MSARGDAWTRYGSGALAAAWLDAVQEPFACFDTDLRLLYANRAFEKATGRPFDDCAGRPIPDLQPFGDATQSVLALLAEVRDGQSEAEEELTWCPDGSNVAQRQQVKVTVERAADGSVDSFLLTARDVTRFRETERKLRDSEAEFATLADNSPDNIIRYGLDGRATYCNQQIAERVNTTARSIVGRRPLDYVPPGMLGLEEYQRVVGEALRTGTPGRVELVVQQPDGSLATHSVLIRAERDAEGTITGALAIGRDVTDLVRARQAAAEKEREFRTLAENAGDEIARWDTSGRVVYANPRLLDLLGLTTEQVRGRTSMEVSQGRLAEVSASIDRVLGGGPAELVEQRFVDRRDGQEHIHQVLCVPEFTDQGALNSVLGVGRDITESVRHREELERIARTDLLTGIPNSQALFDRGPAILDAAQRSGRQAGVLLLDLDGFKAVNDTVGHAGGDQVLRVVAEQVRRQIRSYDLVVRLGATSS
jgi:PAS domain S-box-containing protein